MSESDLDPTTARHVWASRYLSIAGVVVILYDHLLTLDQEVALIWLAACKSPKALFLFLRYMVPIALLIHIYQLSGVGNGELSDTVCKIWFPVGLVVGIVTGAAGNFLVLIHVWNLWERRRPFILWSLVLFIVTQMANIICLVFTLRDLIPRLTFERPLLLCIMAQRGLLPLLWAPGVFFESVMFVVVVWNALDRPRIMNSDFARALCHDGWSYFALLFVLRLANLLVFYLAPMSLIFIGVFFIWCSTTMTVTRLVLKLRRHNVRKTMSRMDQDSDDGEEWSYDHDYRPQSIESDLALSSCAPTPESQYRRGMARHSDSDISKRDSGYSS